MKIFRLALSMSISTVMESLRPQQRLNTILQQRLWDASREWQVQEMVCARSTDAFVCLTQAIADNVTR
ncbi:hypothetical protein MC885_001311 [Smutsia gigantea]|nr:hypothetical protein MC885_001311 [Smutsia gigantea]